MQMFHLSSLKMGLDQAVLTGFESGSSGEGAMTKEEVEKLLRHGAYDIFNEDKAGASERESSDFVEQDIDSILERRSRKVVHENTGTGSAAAGGTFSKASFVSKTPSNDSGQAVTEDIDINDPDFWKKMVGEAKQETESILKPRRRNQANYNEKAYEKNFNKALTYEEASGSDSSDDSDESEEDPDGETHERYRWGGNKPEHWKRNQAMAVIDELEHLGYGNRTWRAFIDKLPKDCSKFSETEVCLLKKSLMTVFSISELMSLSYTAYSRFVEWRGRSFSRPSVKLRHQKRSVWRKETRRMRSGGAKTMTIEAPKVSLEVLRTRARLHLPCRKINRSKRRSKRYGQ
jgi:hypothetical protein